MLVHTGEVYLGPAADDVHHATVVGTQAGAGMADVRGIRLEFDLKKTEHGYWRRYTISTPPFKTTALNYIVFQLKTIKVWFYLCRLWHLSSLPAIFSPNLIFNNLIYNNLI